MKINIKHNTYPLLSFTKKELKFFKLLEIDNDFDKLVIDFRTKNNIPPNGLDASKPPPTEDEEIKQLLNKIMKAYQEAKSLTEANNLPKHWNGYFSNFLLFNTVIIPNTLPISIKQSKEKMTIEVNARVSYTELKLFLNRYEYIIKSLLEGLPGVPNLTTLEFDVMADMLRLVNEGKTISQITKIYSKKKTGFNPEYSIVHRKIERYKQTLKQNLHNSPKEQFVRSLLRQVSENQSSSYTVI
jgi:hypothetical protein